MNEEAVQQRDLADRLRELVVGHRIVSATEWDMTLDNGVRVIFEGSFNYSLAGGEVSLGALVDSEHVITGVKEGTKGGTGGYGWAELFLLTDAGIAMTISQSWDSSDFYFYGIYLTVKEVEQ